MNAIPASLVNAMASFGARLSVDAKWQLQQSKWVFGVDTAAELLDILSEYTVADVVDQIECLMLVLAGEDDHAVPIEMAEDFLELLTCPTTYRKFTTEEGAAEHCQVGNIRLATSVIYDWLDETMAGD